MRAERPSLIALAPKARVALILAIFVLGSMVGAMEASAEDDDFARVARLYVSGHIGGVFYVGPDDSGSLVGSVDIDVDPSVTIDLRYGTRISRFVAWEWQLEYAPQLEVDCSPDLCVDEYDLFNFGINSKIFGVTDLIRRAWDDMPERIQPYGLIGLTGTRIDPDGDGARDARLGLSVRAGAGVLFHIDQNWGVGVEATYLVPVWRLVDFDHVSAVAGVQYTF